MVTVKEAVENAKGFVLDVIGKDEISRLTLEEVEMSGNGEAWLVTLGLSYSDPFDLMANSRRDKVYKVFKVDTGSGDVLAMVAPER